MIPEKKCCLVVTAKKGVDTREKFCLGVTPRKGDDTREMM